MYEVNRTVLTVLGLTLDGVTLVGLPDNDSPLVEIGENGELVLKSGVITGNTRVSNEGASGGGIKAWRETFTMEGGEISGNTASGGKWAHGGGDLVLVRPRTPAATDGTLIAAPGRQGTEGGAPQGARLGAHF